MVRRIFEGTRRWGEKFLGDESVRQVSEQARDWYAGTVSQAKGYGAEKIANAAKQFEDALPFVERAGYRVTEVEVSMGITPALIPHFVLERIVPPEEREALLIETRAHGKWTHNLIVSLFKAADLKGRIRFSDFSFCELEIEAGIIPNVTLKFRPDAELKNEGTGPETIPPLAP